MKNLTKRSALPDTRKNQVMFYQQLNYKLKKGLSATGQYMAYQTSLLNLTLIQTTIHSLKEFSGIN